MIHKLSRNKSIAYILLLSFFFGIITPMSASAGVLGSLLDFVKPHAKILGNIGGAIAGATLGSTFCPPLGTIAGGIVGYVVGGTLANYAAGGLSNIATLAGAAAGYVALSSMGPVGMVAGVFLGGLLGKVAYGLIQKVDQKITGGVVFSAKVNKDASAESVTVGETANNVVVSDVIPASYKNTTKAKKANTSINTDMSLQEATEKYQTAYQKYVTAVRDGANSEDVNKAHQEYVEAYQNYQKISGK